MPSNCWQNWNWIKVYRKWHVWPCVADLPFLTHSEWDAFRVRLPQLPSPMSDMRLGLLPYFQNNFCPCCTNLLYVIIEQKLPQSEFLLPICRSHSIALLPGWQVWCVADWDYVWWLRVWLVFLLLLGSQSVQSLGQWTKWNHGWKYNL